MYLLEMLVAITLIIEQHLAELALVDHAGYFANSLSGLFSNSFVKSEDFTLLAILEKFALLFS